MKKILFLSSTFLLLLSYVLTSQNQNISKAEIKTSAVCEMCKERIEKGLKKKEGIISLNLDVDTKILSLEYDSTKITLDEIRKSITKLGYDADDLKRDPKAYKKLPKCCRIDG
ncbi:MAG: heavy-metal-associated domain-containing protein [Candidatus Kapaibacteriota bacterium]